jgi:hypothetical protein
MLMTTAHEHLRRTKPAKGYVAGRCDASTLTVASDPGARPDKARLLHPPLWDLSFQTFSDRRDASPMPPPGGQGPHLIFQADFDNRSESHRNPVSCRTDRKLAEFTKGLTTHDVECEIVRELTYDIKPGALLT